MLRRVCVCACALACVLSLHPTLMTLILCDFADVIFRCDAMDFPEGIGAVSVRQSDTGREKERGCV